MIAMTVEPVARPSGFDAFLSHASQDVEFAVRVQRSLQANGITAWIDGSNLDFGALLRDELQDAIRNSRVLVLLWSEAASRSRWVMAELFTAFHLDRFIVPCVLDETALPQFLEHTVYANRQRDQGDIGEKLARAIRAPPLSAGNMAPWMGGRSPLLESLINAIGREQISAVQAMAKDRRKAAQANAAAGSSLEHARKLAPDDPMILNLSGYQCKNDYMFAHWDEIQAGLTPKDDPVLRRGEWNFFKALCLNPIDASAVNGLGSILILEHELDAAEFFVRRAIDLMKAEGGDYEAAEQDLALISAYKRKRA